MHSFARLSVVLLCAGCVQLDNPLLQPDGGAGGGGVATGGGGGGGGGGGAGGGGAACTPSWSCSAWEVANGQATRSCLDANVCGTAVGRPDEGPAALPSLDLNFYKCRVQPVVDLSCAMIGCHGKEQGRPYKVYARARLRSDEPVCGGICNQDCSVMVSAQVVSSANHHCSGRAPLTTREWTNNFDSARATLLGVTAAEATLLTQPLSGSAFAHAGVKVFGDSTDPRYQTLLQWLSGATLATCVTNPN